MNPYTRLFAAVVLLFVVCLRVSAQPQIAYIIPDVGAEGMNTYVEIIAPVGAKGTFQPGSGSGVGIYPIANISIRFVNPLDSNRIVVSPCVVSWEGRMLSCQFFVKPGAPPGPVPFRVVVDGVQSNTDTFFIVQPQSFGVKNGGGMIGSGGGWGNRSKRGAMIVDSIVLRSGLYSIDVNTDPDPGTPGHQGYLPAVILSKGPVRIEPGAVIDASAIGKNGGPGGGGGGGYGDDFVTPIPSLFIPGERNTPLGSGFAGGKSDVPLFPAPASSFGQGTGANARSLNGVEANSLFTTTFPTYARLYGAGPGHPFDSDGRSGGAAAATGGSGPAAFGTYYGGGGNATKGTGLPGSQDAVSGQIIGNRQIVPLHGGGGGSSGGVNDSVGAGGGGGIAIYSQLGISVQEVRANGARGADGCGTCGSGGGDAAAGGAGGSIIVGGKLGVGIAEAQAAGGAAGTKKPSAPASSTSGGGGAGRFRHDGRITAGAKMLTPGASVWTGPTIDTLTVATKPLFNVTGTGLPGAQIQVYVRGEDTPWNYASYYTATVRPDSTWSVEVGISSSDSLLYFFALQLTPDSENSIPATTEWTRVPTHIFSQAAANIVRYRPTPDLNAPATFVFDTILCDRPFFDTITISNRGAAPLKVNTVRFAGPGVTILSIISYPLEIPPGETGSIIIRYNGPTEPGLSTVLLQIESDDPGAGKNPWRIELRIFNATKAYIDPDPDSPPVVDFGEVRVNSSLRRNVVIRNLKDVVSTDMLIDSIWFKPPTVGIKTISRSIPKDTPIPPGDSLEIEVEYTPTQEEELTDVYLCVRMAEPCLDTICWQLTGKGVRSAILTSKSSLTMKVSPCAPTDPVYDTVVVTNSGSTPIRLLGRTPSPSAFFKVVDPASGTITLEPGESQRIIVSYLPGAGSPLTGTLTIITDDATLSNIELNIDVEGGATGLAVSVDSLRMSTACVNDRVYDTFDIDNTGSVGVTVTLRLASAGQGAQAFGYRPTNSFGVAAGATQEIEILFTTATAGIFEDTLFITAEPCGLQDTVILRGEVIGLQVTATPDPIDFANTPVGIGTQLVTTITNNGGRSVRITGGQVIPPNVGVTISAFQTFPVMINPGADDFISVDYLPTSTTPIPPGTILELFIDSPCKDTIRIEVTGQGTEAGLSVRPGLLDFGGVHYCLSESDTVWARNIATATIGIRSITTDPADNGFSAELVDPSADFIPVGDSVAVLVTFAPTAPPDGLKSGVLKIETDNSQIGTVDVPVRGVRQTQSLGLSGGPFALTFPGGTDRQTFTITNNGTAPVPITRLVLPPPFRLITTRPTLPRSLAPNESMEVDIEFAPTTDRFFNDSMFVEGITPCDSLFLPLIATSQPILTGDVRWEDGTGRPGEVILLPLKLLTDLTGTGVTSYSVDATFNGTMLLPQRVVLDGTLSQGWTVGTTEIDTGSVFFTATGPTELSDTGTLAYEEMLVLLGNDLTTQITSSNRSRFTTGGATLAAVPGLFTLEGYCSVGGDRLVQVTGNFGIKLVAPNPARDRIAVEFELVEDGATRLVLYDGLGREVYRLVDGNLKANPHRVDTPLDLPPGMYVLELRTPTQREERKVIVEE